MRYIVIIFLTVLFPLTALTASGEPSSPPGLDSFWVALGIGMVIALCGLYLGNQGTLVVFSSYTDVMCSALAVIVPLVIASAMSPLPKELMTFIFAAPILAVTWATWACNKNIFFSLLALFTKLFLVVIWLLAVVLAVVLAFSLGRKKYERANSHSKSQMGFALLAIGGSSVLLGFLVKLGLHSPCFTSLKDWLSGVLPEQGFPDEEMSLTSED